MGVNAQTSVPAFTAGQVLTAAEMTEVNTGIPVFADSTARDAAFGGTGEKVLAEGQYAFLESTNQTLVYDGASWIAVGASGLILIKAQTIGSAVGSVTVTDAFSSSYDNYKVIVSGGLGSANTQMGLKLGSTATGYYRFGTYGVYTGTTVTGINTNNGTDWGDVVGVSTNTLAGSFELLAPNLATRTSYFSAFANSSYSLQSGGYLNDTTQYTAFTLTPATGTITGGTIRVYGYANS